MSDDDQWLVTLSMRSQAISASYVSYAMNVAPSGGGRLDFKRRSARERIGRVCCVTSELPSIRRVVQSRHRGSFCGRCGACLN